MNLPVLILHCAQILIKNTEKDVHYLSNSIIVSIKKYNILITCKYSLAKLKHDVKFLVSLQC